MATRQATSPVNGKRGGRPREFRSLAYFVSPETIHQVPEGEKFVPPLGEWIEVVRPGEIPGGETVRPSGLRTTRPGYPVFPGEEIKLNPGKDGEFWVWSVRTVVPNKRKKGGLKA